MIIRLRSVVEDAITCLTEVDNMFKLSTAIYEKRTKLGLAVAQTLVTIIDG